MFTTQYLHFQGNGKITHSKKTELIFSDKDDLLIQSIYSGISYGTESKLLFGSWPKELFLDDTFKSMQKKVEYPLAYGYSSVGVIKDVNCNTNNYLVGKHVFSFKEHGKYHIASLEDVLFLDGLKSIKSAVLIPNLETALSLTMDMAPIAGERIAVIGLGVVGQLVVSILKQFPLKEVVGIDRISNRCDLSESLFSGFMDNYSAICLEENQTSYEAILKDFDGVIEVSGSLDGLKLATKITDNSGRIVIGSFYDSDDFSKVFTGQFHRSHITLKNSQVSKIPAHLRDRFNKKRRMDFVLDLLKSYDFSDLFTHEFSFEDAQSAYDLLKNKKQESVQVVLNYS